MTLQVKDLQIFLSFVLFPYVCKSYEGIIAELEKVASNQQKYLDVLKTEKDDLSKTLGEQDAELADLKKNCWRLRSP